MAHDLGSASARHSVVKAELNIGEAVPLYAARHRSQWV